jgi:hypothetical protein
VEQNQVLVDGCFVVGQQEQNRTSTKAFLMYIFHLISARLVCAGLAMHDLNIKYNFIPGGNLPNILDISFIFLYMLQEGVTGFPLTVGNCPSPHTIITLNY